MSSFSQPAVSLSLPLTPTLGLKPQASNRKKRRSRRPRVREGVRRERERSGRRRRVGVAFFLAIDLLLSPSLFLRPKDMVDGGRREEKREKGRRNRPRRNRFQPPDRRERKRSVTGNDHSPFPKPLPLSPASCLER